MIDFRMPSLGADMDAGTLVAWRVKTGDAVQRGQVVAEVETDKGIIEVEIWETGVVDEILAAAGAKVPVGTVLARVRPNGTPAASASRVVRASPAARRRARELGVELERIGGTGPHGAVTLEDVETMTRRPSQVPTPPPTPARVLEAAPPSAERMRAAIGAAMARSKREIPHYYLSTTIDLHRALEWLEVQNRARSVTDRLLPAALCLRAVARAARAVPEVNGSFLEGSFRPSAAVHLGAAVSLRGGGLVAPALFDADAKDVGTIMRELADLVRRARAGALRAREMSEATLTVTNLGDLGAEVAFPVIIPPQVAIVGFGRIVSRPWAVDGMLAVRPVVVASLAADHRVSDGHDGARFLAALERALQDPEERG